MSSSTTTLLFHERQRKFLALCGVHALNNLLQEAQFTKSSFDQVCGALSPDSSRYWNPHRSALGLGNYDVNVLLMILEQQQGFTVVWHDARKDVTAALLDQFFCMAESSCCGIVVNLPSTSIWAKVTKGRHWLTLLWVSDNINNSNNNSNKDGKWYNLDSELKEPQVIGDMEACSNLLQTWRKEKDNCHILLVRKSSSKA